jgi:peptide/nickel transport system ATP-binding protein/oligopeptide transport system ATP-binding protein
MSDPLLRVRDLKVSFAAVKRSVTAVDGVSFDIKAGEIFGLVGESGCGKSVTCRSLIRLFGGAGPICVEGSIHFEGRELVGLADSDFIGIRGSRIAMIFQDPMTALNPTMRIGRQIQEGLIRHGRLAGRSPRTAAIDLLRSVGVTAAERRLDAYPHAFSGGMRQRVLIAIALACRPKLLIADEPTTALDVTIQDQILKLILRLREETGMAVLFVTHDLGVVAQTCDRVAVMYAGRIAEIADTGQLFGRPSHPYTCALLGALPAMRGKHERLEPIGGAPPHLSDPPSGCRFHPRCRLAVAQCAGAPPPLAPVGPGHGSACIRIGELA